VSLPRRTQPLTGSRNHAHSAKPSGTSSDRATSVTYSRLRRHCELPPIRAGSNPSRRNDGLPHAARSTWRCAHLAPLYVKTLPGCRVGFLVADPGSGLSEEPTSGVRSVTLDCRVVPECSPVPAASRRFWSAIIGGWTTLDSRRLNARIASI